MPGKRITFKERMALKSGKPIVVLKKEPQEKKRKLFTVSEDMLIYQYWVKHRDRLSVMQIADDLHVQLKRSKDSIRDRIRRYLAVMNSAEIESMKNMHKVTDQ